MRSGFVLIVTLSIIVTSSYGAYEAVLECILKDFQNLICGFSGAQFFVTVNDDNFSPNALNIGT